MSAIFNFKKTGSDSRSYITYFEFSQFILKFSKRFPVSFKIKSGILYFIRIQDTTKTSYACGSILHWIIVESNLSNNRKDAYFKPAFYPREKLLPSNVRFFVISNSSISSKTHKGNREIGHNEVY